MKVLISIFIILPFVSFGQIRFPIRSVKVVNDTTLVVANYDMNDKEYIYKGGETSTKIITTAPCDAVLKRRNDNSKKR